jgi:glycosyltransferase involved in cell wall biosynthesis
VNNEIYLMTLLTVIVPAHNEADSIANSLRRLRESLEGIDFKIIVIDDGSLDSTKDEVLALQDGLIKVMSYSPNQGKGFALRTGMLLIKSEFGAYIDADLDVHPSAIRAGIETLQSNESVGIVLGSKTHSDSIVHYPFSRRCMSRIYNTFISILFNLHISDTQTGLKVFRTKDIMESVRCTTSRGFAFDLELLARLQRSAVQMEEVPVNIDYQFSSSVGVRNIFEMVLNTLLIWKELKKSSRN